jgi:glycosyltransferase involved in cell wall biosynthesis
LAALESGPDTKVLKGDLSSEQYARALAEADILLFPYERASYRLRCSGVFAEAASCGKVLVVPSGTWMADRITNGEAAGVIYDGNESAAIADAVIAAVENLPTLASAAWQARPIWPKKYSTEAFVAWAEAEIEGRGGVGAGEGFGRRMKRKLRFFGSAIS